MSVHGDLKKYLIQEAAVIPSSVGWEEGLIDSCLESAMEILAEITTVRGEEFGKLDKVNASMAALSNMMERLRPRVTDVEMRRKVEEWLSQAKEVKELINRAIVGAEHAKDLIEDLTREYGQMKPSVMPFLDIKISDTGER